MDAIPSGNNALEIVSTKDEGVLVILHWEVALEEHLPIWTDCQHWIHEIFEKLKFSEICN